MGTLLHLGAVPFHCPVLHFIDNFFMKKIIIAGGTGFLGTCLANHYSSQGVNVIVLTRGESRRSGMLEHVHWNGKNSGAWTEALEGADALINLNGKSVDCRYNEKNKALIYSTRLDSTAALGKAIQKAMIPPKVWINAASATIYRHSLDKEMDEESGEIGSGFSVDVCLKWEATFNSFHTPQTRKVLIRTGIVLGRDGGPLKPLRMLAKFGVGGKQGDGTQYFSWLHERDFVNIIDYLITHNEMSGVFNVTAPTPVPNITIMKALRNSVGVPFGLPMPVWLLEIGSYIIRTETELVLKSRRVVPKRLLQSGYRFQFNTIESALADLCQ
jgi:uncharacterized protein (TIGR01777 family)